MNDEIDKLEARMKKLDVFLMALEPSHQFRKTDAFAHYAFEIVERFKHDFVTIFNKAKSAKHIENMALNNNNFLVNNLFLDNSNRQHFPRTV